MDDDAATGVIDERHVRLDGVERFHLEAAPIRPDRCANSFFRQQVGDLVRLDSVMEGADLVAELVRDVDHLRHFV